MVNSLDEDAVDVRSLHGGQASRAAGWRPLDPTMKVHAGAGFHRRHIILLTRGCVKIMIGDDRMGLTRNTQREDHDLGRLTP
jgi:hypothetical protein